MGKSTVSTGPFSIVMLVYQRVTHKKSLVISYFIPIIFEKQFHKPSPSHHHVYRWYVYHSQSWVVYIWHCFSQITKFYKSPFWLVTSPCSYRMGPPVISWLKKKTWIIVISTINHRIHRNISTERYLWGPILYGFPMIFHSWCLPSTWCSPSHAWWGQEQAVLGQVLQGRGLPKGPRKTWQVQRWTWDYYGFSLLVGGIPTPLQNMSQLGLWFPIYGKIKNVPNHQPGWVLYVSPC